ncbi:MAG: phage tail protein [Ardenticatenaceae bacterium]|nr:phage tail protein [Ardenticatenaceae bacterium]
MAELRELPYNQFNFLVDLGGDYKDKDVHAGFQEVSGLGVEVALAEYRNGNELDNAPRKVPGLYKVPDVTFKRGVIGAVDLFNWLKETREGKQAAKRTVTIQLLSEERKPVLVWKLTNAFPMKYTAPGFNGKGSDVAIEELVVACERIDME